jgi:hypothetical protein
LPSDAQPLRSERDARDLLAFDPDKLHAAATALIGLVDPF